MDDNEVGHVDTSGDCVIGVYRHAAGWEIKYIQRGKRISRYRRTREAADDFAARKAVALCGPAALPGAVIVDETASGERATWTAALEKYRDILIRDPDNVVAHDAIRSLSIAANAAAKIIDAESRRRRIDDLERRVEALKKARPEVPSADGRKRRKPTESP